MIETAQDRAALAETWGDTLRLGAARVPGFFDYTRDLELDVEGYVPVFTGLAADLTAAGAVPGAGGVTVERHDGAILGPFAVASAPAAELDGMFTALMLTAA